MKQTHIHTPRCKTVYKYICDNLDAGMNSPECKAIKTHIDRCKNCTAYLDSLKKTLFLYREYKAPKVSARTHKKLFAAISLASGKRP